MPQEPSALDHGVRAHAAGEARRPEAYTRRDRERRWPEPAKNPRRTAFERDRARVLHSSALRRLGAKTQVLGPASDDFVRTRLTHSLEVAQVGRELGKALGCDPDVVDAACLSHDLGHPPFGHNGERALDEVAAGIGGFEGNAQTLRLLTRLEPKTFADDGASAGLNLTRASLDAATKYPWRRGDGPARPDGTPTRKFGVYEDDLPVFDWLREGAPPGRRCLEAQVMDLSDDIAYSVHDVEDAIVGGRVDLERVRRTEEQQRVVGQVRAWYDPPVDDDALGAAIDRLVALPIWMRAFDGSRRDLAGIKNMTSQLIGRFCGAAEAATRAASGEGRLTRYAADLVVPPETLAEIVVLKGVAALYVMAPRELEPLYLSQRTIIFDLVDALLETGDRHLEPPFVADFHAAADDAARLRVVVDQVASLTDTSANQWHARLRGMLSEVF
ncbi:deoxyguanosinetriphosphate triphosphohydrolase [Georgenia ruanii]|uniref:Deoxyguanosinetriphosphate triphosphohydrolase-like protein n=1 Tax=Georgenia ruanii TaxID=348442 RepID=A0A7J9UUK2_9MICO|nr:deoxyguanosinetriphosphate triphosphohydrolase [Georgenia ruanii]MPV88309.1 deoxyguanosinetriphosphate triphosphohydrolase [Georgenia ruanii]